MLVEFLSLFVFNSCLYHICYLLMSGQEKHLFSIVYIRACLSTLSILIALIPSLGI